MEIGIDSFAAAFDETAARSAHPIVSRNLLEQIEHADQVGLDVVRHRRAPPPRVPRLRPGGHPRRGGRAHASASASPAR